MKKALKGLLIIIFGLCPILLSACGSTNYYTITVNSSDTALGSVSKDKADSSLEDTKVTLLARENNPESNPLLGWVKDNEYLVKIANHTTEERDNKLELSSSAAAEGHYTAVFKENLDSMMYAYVKKVTLLHNGDTPFPEEELIRYELSYSITSTGSDNYFPFEDKIGKDINTNILYFGGPGQDLQFKFKITVTLGTPELGELGFTLINPTIISKSNFSENQTLIFEHETPGWMVSAKFELSKFSEEMFELVAPKEENK